MERDIKVQLTHHNDYINRSNIEKISPQQLFKKKNQCRVLHRI